MRKIHLIFFILVIQSFKNIYASSLRGEPQRYTLLHDRFTVDRILKKEILESQFFDLDLAASSGIRSLMNDIKTGTENVGTSAQKQLNMFQVLSKNINSEKYIDLDVTAGIPLFDIKYKKYKFLPSFYFNLNFGVLFTTSNKDDATNPTGQLYIKKESKMGVQVAFPKSKQEFYFINLYQMKRADTLSIVTSQSLATSGELFNFDSLENSQETIRLDLMYKKIDKHREYTFEFRELSLLKQKDVSLAYRNNPFLRTQLLLNYDFEKFTLSPFFGVHQRVWYPIHQGLYIGSVYKSKTIPIQVIGKLSYQFITLIPQFKTKYFQVNYALKNPYRNPQDNIWVSSIHSINLGFPFP